LIHVINFHQIHNKVCLHSIICQPLNCVISCTLFFMLINHFPKHNRKIKTLSNN
jgi:hypothetical protein